MAVMVMTTQLQHILAMEEDAIYRHCSNDIVSS